MRNIVMYITVCINVVAMLSLIVGVLLHSGQGGGLSDMFGGAGGASMGSAAAERNLNRITTVLAVTWLTTVVALGFLLAV
ncbi:MAG: preprotein translocase subunit SecG [Actinobacteria bacterium]|nr:preprotein translocase subunit SecG [Actinomycetota bacterium]